MTLEIKLVAHPEPLSGILFLFFFFLESEHNAHSVSLTYIDGSVEPRIASFFEKILSIR